VVERATGAKTFLHADRLGSIIATANANGAITGQAKYSPYGVTTGSIPTIFGYTGHQYDREIGIYYARARTYMPLIGRFMQVDPVGYKQSLNLYTYGMGNPMAGTDPSGGFFIGLGIAAIQFAIGELTATAFLSTIAEIAIGELVTRGLDMLIPGAGQVLGIVRTVVGFITSPGFGGGAGAIKNAAHGGPVNGGGLSGHFGVGDGVGLGYGFQTPKHDPLDPDDWYLENIVQRDHAEMRRCFISCTIDDALDSLAENASVSGTVGYYGALTLQVNSDGTTDYGLGIGAGASAKPDFAGSITLFEAQRRDPSGWGLAATVTGQIHPILPVSFTGTFYYNPDTSAYYISLSVDGPTAGYSTFLGVYKKNVFK